MMGIAEEDPVKQIVWNELAIKIVEESKFTETTHWLGPLLNNTGRSVFDLKDYSKDYTYLKIPCIQTERRETSTHYKCNVVYCTNLPGFE